MKRARDSQRQKVYDWERKHWGPWEGDGDLTLAQCDALIKRVYALYGYPPPMLKDGRRCKRAYGGKLFIKLPRWSRRDIIVLHECAHGLALYLAPESAFHGPQFVRIYIELIAWHKKLAISELTASAKAAGIQVGPPELKRVSKTERVCIDKGREAIKRVRQEREDAHTEMDRLRRRIVDLCTEERRIQAEYAKYGVLL